MFLLFLSLISTCEPDQTVYKNIMWSGIVNFAILIRLLYVLPKPFSSVFFPSIYVFHLHCCHKLIRLLSKYLLHFQHLIHFWRLIANDWDGWDQHLTTFDMFATHFFDQCLFNGIKLGLIFIWKIDNKTIRYFETMLPFNTLTSC